MTVAEQRELWSAAPRDWAELAEPANAPLFARVLDAVLAPGARLLDVACGSGYLARMAVERGALVTGVDVTPGLLEIARERAPQATFVEGAMAALPFPDGAFDAVTGVNAFQFALDPVGALREAARVLAYDGRLAAAAFAEPERNEGTALHLAMKALVPDTGDGYAPYALSTADGLEAAVKATGLRHTETGEVELTWAYPDASTAIRALLASAGGARAVRAAGEPAVREAILGALPPFTDAAGAIALHNVFRYVVAIKR